MDELSKEYVISFYNKSFQMHGDRPEAVRFTSAGQQLRYETLLDIDASIDGSKILDYGCGKGDFYQFLRERNVSVDYTGFDINEHFISLARKKYPECRFMKFDVEEEDVDEDFDYIFICGVFNLKVQGIDDTIKNTLSKLFKHCRRALAFNALSDSDPRKDPELNYVSSQDMLAFATNNLSPHVSIINDRVSHDFTMFVHRNVVAAKEV